MKVIEMTENDLAQIRNQIKIDWILLFFISLVASLFYYISNDNGFFGKLILVIAPLTILLFFINRLVIYQDLISKKKYSGDFRVIEKIKMDFSDAGEGPKKDKIYYFIKFDDWRIGKISFEKKYWENINVDDIFKIEQAVNSSLILKIMKGETNFKKAIVGDYLSKRSLMNL